MQVETLKIFCDVIETQSFSKAAMLNYISQSAVSQQIRGLEEKYDRKMIERGKRNLAPTQAGRILYEGAKTILDGFRLMESRIQVLSKTIAGSVRVATVYSVGLHELPAYMKEFMRRFPSANIHVEYDRANRIYDSLLNGTIDLGIVAYPTRKSGVEVIPFREDQLVLITAPDHPLARSRRVELGKIARSRFIAFERDIPTRRAIDRALRARNVPVEVIMEFDNIETIKRAVEIGAGVSIVPGITVRGEIETGTLAVVELTGGDLRRPLGILCKKGKERTQVMDKFIEVLVEGAPASIDLDS
jgi:DNA-binding transcriptional LysR family regulator